MAALSGFGAGFGNICRRIFIENAKSNKYSYPIKLCRYMSSVRQERKAEEILPEKQPEKQMNAVPVQSSQDINDGFTEEIQRFYERRREANRRCLFVSNLPNLLEDEEEAVSKDIKNIKRLKRNSRVAFLEFDSEKLAEKNFKLLKGKKIKNIELQVDYVGEKSLKAASKSTTETIQTDEFDPLQLYITGFTTTFTYDDLMKLFPKASSLKLPRGYVTGTLLGYAFAEFTDQSLAFESFKKVNGSVVDGKEILVTYAKKIKPLY